MTGEAGRRVTLAAGFRLQFEPTRQEWVLLYPEGLVELSETAAAVLGHCLAPIAVPALVEELERQYDGADLTADVEAFLGEAVARGWIVDCP